LIIRLASVRNRATSSTRILLLHMHNFLSRCFRTSFSAFMSHCVFTWTFFSLTALNSYKRKIVDCGNWIQEMTRMKAISRHFRDPRSLYDVLCRSTRKKIQYAFVNEEHNEEYS